MLPALKRALDSSNQRHMVAACMMAMAKIRQDHKDFQLLDVFKPRLRSKNQQVRETAALAMGLAGITGEEALDQLIALSLDSPAGAELTGGPVRSRTRAFALYGLGLYAQQHTSTEPQRRALTTFRSVLEDKQLRDRNLKIAAIHGIGLLSLTWTDATDKALLDVALDTLSRYYTKRSGPGTRLVQSHCPTAITKLLQCGHPRRDEFMRLFLADISGADKERLALDLGRSCTLALGQLGAVPQLSSPPDNLDRKCGELLRANAESHTDEQTCFFTLMALGQIGGEQNVKFLLRHLDGDDQAARPWAALAIGVQAFTRHKARADLGEVPQPELEIGEALKKQFDVATDAQLVGALAIALGLARHIDAGDAMQQRLLANLADEEQASYLALGLGIMGDRTSIEAIRQARNAAKTQPYLIWRTATALALLGDKTVSEKLQKSIGSTDTPLGIHAAQREALGMVGDRRSIAPLISELPELDPFRGSMTATALGNVARIDTLPWHTLISANFNYRAAVETLTNLRSGVLDLR